MEERNSFAKNLKFLRRLYSLSLSEMAMIINLKSKGSLSTLENAKNPPSFDTLVNIVNVFAVKVDWLFGRSSRPYDEEIFFNLENKIMNISLSDNVVFKDIVFDKYSDKELRSKIYPLKRRAYLIFLLKFLKAITEKHPELLHKNIDVGFLKSMAKQESTLKRWSKKPDELYMQLLHFIAVEIYK